jgi:type I restriction enzyme R subunit
MSSGPEFTQVENPLIDQLIRMGWKFTTGNGENPTATGRRSFRDVLLIDELRDALRRINPDTDGHEWLDDARLDEAVKALERIAHPKLIEANQEATELLLKGIAVDGLAGWDQGRQQTIRFIDWDNWSNNTFRAINQFKVRCPAGRADQHIIPDIVLFVNGIPLVVIEAKSPTAPGAMSDAISQLQRYANQRKPMGVVTLDEGCERLFHTSQFVVATRGEEARIGTFTSLANHFLEWKDTSPVTMVDVLAEQGKVGGTLTSQEKLVAGSMRPSHLLDIIRHFTLFMEADGRTVKTVCRYQQYRAVRKAIERMKTGRTRLEDGESDRRGGLVWHTQGSGKSLTMVFLIRAMRSDQRLRGFKVVVVTDRTDLEKQLKQTAKLTAEPLTVVKAESRGAGTVSGFDVLKATLSRPGKDLVFAMIQKYRGSTGDAEGWDGDAGDEDADDSSARTSAASAGAPFAPMPVLNESQDVVVLVDEAHRSHTSTAHANLMQALPNCVKIGFTGTPILMNEKALTTRIFGEFIDRYRIREAQADGAIVPILYEGRTAGAAVKDGSTLDGLFEDMFADRTAEDLEAIKEKYATKGRVAEAVQLIEAKARDILRHYIDNILPNGFKAQVVAVSRLATLRYREAFLKERAALVDRIERLPAGLLALDEGAVMALPAEQAFLVRAHRFLPTIKAIEFAPVISGGHNDTVDPAGEWSSKAVIDARIARFKKRLFADGPNTFSHEKADPLAFLIVKSMLLTGFDAPIEQVMYLDRPIKEAELLQAVARVNRTCTLPSAAGEVAKRNGIVVDYYGVGNHLKRAMAVYDSEDVDGALDSMADELPKLRDQHERVLAIFSDGGVPSIYQTEACVELLQDERLRADFQVKLKQFFGTLDFVLPRPEGLPFVRDSKQLALIQAKARNRYRSGERLIGAEVGEKVRRLIDEHILSLGIDPRVPPVEITSIEFEAHVDREASPRAKASEMEHALRYHIRKHLDEDPARYQRLSERLKEILDQYRDRWDEMVAALAGVLADAREGRRGEEQSRLAVLGLDPALHGPFFDLLGAEVGTDAVEGERQQLAIRDVTIEIVDHLAQEVSIVDFWNRVQAREDLRRWIVRTLDDANLLPFDKIQVAADRLMELAKANHQRLVS